MREAEKYYREIWCLTIEEHPILGKKHNEVIEMMEDFHNHMKQVKNSALIDYIENDAEIAIPRKQVELEVKDTIGYNEAENKKSFMTGVSVAISKIEVKYENLQLQLKCAKQNGEMYEKDLKTFASIVDRYSENEIRYVSNAIFS